MLPAQSKVLGSPTAPGIGRARCSARRPRPTDSRVFSDSDAALEWCENRILLESLPAGGNETPVPLASMDAMAGLDDGDRARSRRSCGRRVIPAGAVIIREGDAADALFLPRQARVSVWLALPRPPEAARHGDAGRGIRRPRPLRRRAAVADVIADEPSVCSSCPWSGTTSSSRSHPGVRTRLMANLAREMAARLRSADAEIRTLEE